LKMISNFMQAPSAPLSELKEGARGVLREMNLAPKLTERLMNLGFLPGVEILVAGSGPGGDPRIYRVDGAEIALRAEVARRIVVRLTDRRAEA